MRKEVERAIAQLVAAVSVDIAPQNPHTPPAHRAQAEYVSRPPFAR